MELIETKQRFIEMRAAGYSFDKIAKELGKSKQTLIDWSKELQEEIANLKALELDTLYEKYFLLKENRLQSFGEVLVRLKDELATRNLSDIPTDKLLELFVKYNALAKDEIVEPMFRSSKEITEAQEERRLLEMLTAPETDNRLKLYQRSV